jgi:hypothetical protein
VLASLLLLLLLLGELLLLLLLGELLLLLPPALLEAALCRAPGGVGSAVMPGCCCWLTAGVCLSVLMDEGMDFESPADLFDELMVAK